ncbi:Transcription factor like [Melia azedarach]|uniref:Transcription factor like n=2 Tax=Melia azedarach TaxID=155640 RepID=A0ACC1Z0T3_MELAZ|nr:Transcription factor like [Melia azedarach]KAJ4729342.1 Transcription factor like [Melia azedarach]
MPEASKSLLASTNHDILKPDYFGYYTREIMELLSQDEDFLPFASRTSEFTKRDYGGVRSMDTSKDSFNGIFSSFSNSIGAELSDIKKERLKSLLRQGVFDLTPEVDEMLDPVISMCQLQSQLRRKCSSNVIGAAAEGDAEQVPHKKLKTSSSSSSANTLNGGSCREDSVANHIDSKSSDAALLEKEISNFKKNCVSCHFQKSSQWITGPEGPKSLCDACRSIYGKERDLHSDSNMVADKENGEVNDDLQFLLETNGPQVDKTVKKYSDELFAKLEHMEQQLEELLNAVMSKCRPMTRAEKQELRKLIQMLPQRNLNRVVEIVQHSKLAETRSSGELFVDLEQEDNVTLWRLYYYVKAVEKAGELLV